MNCADSICSACSAVIDPHGGKKRFENYDAIDTWTHLEGDHGLLRSWLQDILFLCIADWIEQLGRWELNTGKLNITFNIPNKRKLKIAIAMQIASKTN